MNEEVILVDENNNEIGTAPKDSVHTKDTPLHRAFSCFVFNDKKELLVTQRAITKKTFPGVWTNTVCGHPGKGETAVEAAQRRLKDELGLVVRNVIEVSPYRYRFTDKNGVVENEICPILVGYTNDNPMPRDGEVEDWKWMDWEEFKRVIAADKRGAWSEWCKEEAGLVDQIIS